jgi:hypothetical protein
MNTKAKVRIMQAHLDGNPIEFQRKSGQKDANPWKEISSGEVEWDWIHYDYKIASPETRNKIEIMQAFADGKPLEWKIKDDETWCDMSPNEVHNSWAWDRNDYRVKE